MDTDFLYRAQSKKKLEDVILPEKRNQWDSMRSTTCPDIFTANAPDFFFPRKCCNTHQIHDKREPDLFKVELRYTDMLCVWIKTYSCFDQKGNIYQISRKGLNDWTSEDWGDGAMSMFREVLDESVNVTSTKRKFPAIQESVATSKSTKKIVFFPLGKNRRRRWNPIFIHCKTLLSILIHYRNLHLSTLLNTVRFHRKPNNFRQPIRIVHGNPKTLSTNWNGL